MPGSSLRWCALPLLLAVVPAAAATPRDTPADSVPSPEAFLGYPMGAHFTPAGEVRAYARALADASAVVEYRAYGATPERRELFHLVVSSPAHLRDLDRILAENAELARPATPAARASEIAARNPAVVYFSYGIHGDEAASSEAAMWTAWDLARGDASLAGVLDSLVVVLDPVANPDGRARYVGWYRGVVGEAPNPNPAAREHHEPWPGGRYNHYLLDLNRDWAWMTQPETRARLGAWSRWNPVVHVDFHEMSAERSYFFFPAARPVNPIYPRSLLDWQQRIGLENARVFDAAGWAYFTGDEYDYFYPGYGDTWPGLTGAVGMTYEQAGSGYAGLAVVRSSGDTLTLRERIAHHRATGEATLRTVAAGKTRLLEDHAAAQRGIGHEEADFLLVPGADSMAARALVAHLRAQGIEVERAARPFRAAASPYPGVERRGTFAAGTFRVRARQPRGRLATTLLQPQTPLDAEYSYDISAWSLPYAYGVAAYRTRGARGAEWAAVEPVAGDEAPAPPAGYGYLALPGNASDPGVVRYLRQGGRVRVLSRAATVGGRRWPAGSWFLPARPDEPVQAMAAEAGLGALVTPVGSGLADAGSDLGSGYVWAVRLPRVAVLTGEGVEPTSYGAAWYFLEQVLRLPFDAVPLADVVEGALRTYDVVLLPETEGAAPGDPTLDALRQWVEAGGRLVAVGEGARAVAPRFGVRLRGTEAADAEGSQTLLATRAERERRDRVQGVPGAILPVRLDPRNPLAWGAGTGGSGDALHVLHLGTLSFEPARELEPAAYFAPEMQPAAGMISPASVEALRESVWLGDARAGRGSVVLFADDPLFRLFWVAAHPMLTRALLIGPRS